MKIHKGDTVIILHGKDRGKTGKVLRVSPRDRKVAVEGLNMVKRHVRPRQQGQKGQIIARERLVSASGVAFMCKSCGKQTRVGYSLIVVGEKKQKVRICRKCKAEL